jgi:hypothetical protein
MAHLGFELCIASLQPDEGRITMMFYNGYNKSDSEAESNCRKKAEIIEMCNKIQVSESSKSCKWCPVQN